MANSSGLSRRQLLGSVATALAAGSAAVVLPSLVEDSSGATPAYHIADLAGGVGDDGGWTIPDDPRVYAAHLLRRTGFAPRSDEIDAIAGLTLAEMVDRVMDFGAADDVDEVLASLGVDPLENPQEAGRWWALRMVHSTRPMLERMTLFWHDHFATAIHKVKDPWLMLGQNELLREMALGNFRDLVLATAKDPAMLVWLDNRLNVKGSPNENYARELMELHTTGPGIYTEDDVKEAARAFTGWGLIRENQQEFRAKLQELQQQLADDTLTNGERRMLLAEIAKLERDYPLVFHFFPGQHDYGEKTFLGETGPWDGDDIIDILVKQDACADFVCRKLYSHFVGAEPTDGTMNVLKATYFDSEYELRPVVREIVLSRPFFSDEAYRARIKSPAEFVAGSARALGAETNGFGLTYAMAGLGQQLFDPPNPAGWPGGLAWINSNTVITRSNTAMAISAARGKGGADAYGSIDPAALIGDAEEAGEIVERLVDLLLDGNVTNADLNAMVEYLHTGAGGSYEEFDLSDKSVDEKVRGLVYLILSSPLYQLS